MAAIAIVKNSVEVKRIVQMKILEQKRPRIFVTAPDAALECERRRIPYEPVEKYQDLDKVEAINQIAHALSTKWWRSPSLKGVCSELNSYNGITLGHTIELPFYHVFAEAVRSVFIAQKLIETEKPDALLLFNDSKTMEGGFWVGFRLNLKSDAIRLVALDRNIPVNEFAMRSSYRAMAQGVKVIRSLESKIVAFIRWFLKKSYRLSQTTQFGSQNGDSRVLVYAEGRHADAMRPLLHDMMQDPSLSVMFLTQDMSDSCLSALKDVRAKLFDPLTFWSASLRRQAANKSKAIRDRWRKINQHPELQKLGEEQVGVSLWSLVGFQFHWLFHAGIYELLKRIELAQRTLEHLKPQLLLTPVDSSVNDLCWILTAQSREISCLTQLHGAVYVKPSITLWGTEYSDKLAVWGPLTQEWHVEATGRPREDFVCVGYPLFETYAEQFNKISPDSIYTRLGLDRDRPVVLFLVSMAGGAPGSYYLSQLQIYQAFFQGMANLPEIQVIVRTHPASDTRLPRAYARRNLHCVVNPPLDLVSLLKVADIVVGQPTTGLLEAMLVGKPVLFFSVMMSRDMTWWLQYGEINTIHEPSQLSPAILSLLQDPKKRSVIIRNQNEFLERFVGPVDGKASQRTIWLMKQIIKEKLHQDLDGWGN